MRLPRASYALAVLLAVAAALRLVGLEYGLPFGLLNPDEQSMVRSLSTLRSSPAAQ